MNKPHFIICADITSVGIESNGKASLLRLGAEIQKNNYEVSVVFYVSTVGDPNDTTNIPAGHHIIDLHPHFGIGFEEFAKKFPDTHEKISERRFSKVQYAQSVCAMYGLKPADKLTISLNPNIIPIYPDALADNPLKANNVIRYHGFKPGLLLNQNDKGYKYDQREFNLASSKNTLSNPDFVLFDPHVDEIFMKLGRPRTEDRLYNMSYVGKSKVLNTYHPIPNAIEIDREWPDRYKLFRLLSNCNYLYTLDSYSHIISEAILCGAVPIIVSTGPWSNEEIDTGELGPIPRLEVSDIKNAKVKLINFNDERKRLLNTFEMLQRQWPLRVAEFIKCVIEHFYEAKRARQTHSLAATLHQGR